MIYICPASLLSGMISYHLTNIIRLYLTTTGELLPLVLIIRRKWSAKKLAGTLSKGQGSWAVERMSFFYLAKLIFWTVRMCTSFLYKTVQTLKSNVILYLTKRCKFRFQFFTVHDRNDNNNILINLSYWRIQIRHTYITK